MLKNDHELASAKSTGDCLPNRLRPICPWDSWQRTYVLSQPTVSFHEVFHTDETAYRSHEVVLMRQLAERGTKPDAQSTSVEGASR